MVLRSTAAAAASLAGYLMRSRHALFTVLCFAMGAALLAQQFVTAAAEIHLHQGVYVCVVTAVAALFYWAILSIHFLVTHTEGKPAAVPGVDRTAAESPTSSPSGHPIQRFVVLCLTTGALLHVEPLMGAAAELHIHPGNVAGFVLAVTALFNWELLSLNFHVARWAAERGHKNLRRATAQAAPAARSPHLARLSFLFLAALMSVSWFVEPFVAAAELWLSKVVIVVFVLLFAALFNLSVHVFRSFFLPEPQAAVAAAAQGHGVGAITAGVVGIGIATLACVVGAGGSAYYAFAPARS